MEDEKSKLVLNQNLGSIKNEIKQKNPKKELLLTCLNSMHFLATSIALIPDLISGIKTIALLMGISI